MLVDVWMDGKGITGKDAEKALEAASITVNKNTIPFDQNKPFVASGLRIAAVTRHPELVPDLEEWWFETYGKVALTGEAVADEQSAAVKESLAFVNVALVAFAGIALFVGSFIIWNTFSMQVAQRTRELALLRALCGQLIESSRARQIERRIVRAAMPKVDVATPSIERDRKLVSST